MNKGFIALTAVILMATGVLTFSLVVSSVALAYSDSVLRQEMRIQARYFVVSCLETLTIMLAKDYFLNGEVSVPEFGCEAIILNDQFPGTLKINVVASINEVRARGLRVVSLSRDELVVVSEEIQ